MLGATGGRFMGPSGSQPHRNFWPPTTAGRTLEFQTSGEVTESLFAAGGYNTPPASSPFMSCPLELVTKNFHSGSVQFSQANSIVVQSHTDFLSGTSVAKKTETCIGRWEHGSLEPLQIHVPPLTSVTNLGIKSENISSGSTRSKLDCGSFDGTHYHDGILNLSPQTTTDQQHPQTTVHDIHSGCSRTIPISWTPHTNTTHSHPDTSCLLQIKREPCQVSEVTTSNGLGPNCGLTAVVKIESPSPKQHHQMDHGTAAGLQNSGGAIPVGIAVARQRLQEHANVQQPKDINRFGIGIADLGGIAPSGLSQNMFFAGTNASTMIPLASEALQMGVSNVQNSVRTPPTLWQYPTPVSMESMLPMPIPPVGFQLVRDPATGHYIFLPTTTLEKIYVSYLEPFQQAVVWPTYSQQSMQPSHLLIPPMAPQIQPPPLAPLQLLGSDYLTATASTTLHQHTQTHSTRLVALTETKRKPTNSANIPLPIPSHTLIKIEDCSGSSSTCGGGGSSSATHHQQSTIYEQEKSTIQTATIATSVQTNDIPAHLYYQHPTNLIQIAPHNHAETLESSHHVIMPQMSPPTEASACLTPPPEHIIHDLSMHHHEPFQSGPEVQDANIQTDLLSEDDNTNECSFPASEHSGAGNEEIHKFPPVTSSTVSTQHDNHMCHRMEMDDDDEHESEMHQQHVNEEITNINSSGGNNDFSTISTLVTSPRASPVTTTPTHMMSSTITNVQIFQNEKVETKLFGKCDIIKISVPPTTPIEATPNDVLCSPSFENNPAVPSPPPVAIQSQPQQQQFLPQILVNEVNLQTTPVKPNIAHLNPPMVDVSGLELLSNSIEAFEKKVVFNIKQEPIDEVPEEAPQQSMVINNIIPKTNDGDGELEGLNLLCALAEQRFKEEIDQDHSSKTPSRENSQEKEHKRRRHKHSKSNKKSKHDRKDRKRKHRTDDEEEDDEEEVGGDIKDTLDRVKAKYPKCMCTKLNRDEKCCREKCNWPSTAEIFSAMENDMKMRLADITRQCEEKQRELDEIRPILKTLQHQKSFTPDDSKPAQIFPTSSSAFTTAATTTTTKVPIPIVSPNFSNSSQSESNLIELPKLSSDTDVESNSSEKLSKRKLNVPKKHDDNNLTETIFAKKPKSLVGYILASKNRMSESSVKGGVLSYSCDMDDKKSSKKYKSSTKERHSSKLDEDESNSLPPTVVKTPSPFHHAIIKTENDDENSKPGDNCPIFTSDKKLVHKSAKHSKHKKPRDKERKHHRRSSEVKERKRRVDGMCILTEAHLEKDNNTRVITAMGGLFYAGRLSAIEPPDVYAVTLDGERGNRPHIMSREEILRDAIIEVAPRSIEEVPPGTRVCAFWSQQYRCLYPGTVAEPGSPDSVNEKFVRVEFDDGDNGRIAIEDIRFLLTDYPIVVYDPNPLLTLGKRKRRTSHGIPEGVDSSTNITDVSRCFGALRRESICEEDTKLITSSDKEAHRERRRLKKLKRDKLKVLGATNGGDTSADIKKHKKKHRCGDELCKHRKHKKRRKHKKHHREEMQMEVSGQSVSGQDDDLSREDDGRTYEVVVKEPSVSRNVQDDEENEEDMEEEEDEEEEEEEDVTEAVETAVPEDNMTGEEEVASSAAGESLDSFYEPCKKKERQNSAENHSKIAAFLPARQLWAWAGKGFKRTIARGRQKKTFFRMIQRGKEIISVGDSAVFLSTGRPDRPYIGRIESMWETSVNNRIVRVKWFYHPEETEGCPKLKYPGALFESPHEDENDVQTISHKCEVLPLPNYTNKFGPDPKMYVSIYDNNDTYYLAGHYDPTQKLLKFQPDIPTLDAGSSFSVLSGGPTEQSTK